MSEESLLTAARRVVRFMDVNAIQDGGLITNDTLHAVETLRQQVQIETDRQKLLAAKAAAANRVLDGWKG